MITQYKMEPEATSPDITQEARSDDCETARKASKGVVIVTHHTISEIFIHRLDSEIFIVFSGELTSLI